MFVLLLPLLQAVAAVCTIWGFANTANTNSTVITYGAAEVDPAEWLNSYGSLAFGVISWVASKYIKKKFMSNLLLAAMAEAQAPGNPIATRNLGLAFCDWMEERHGADNTDIGRYYLQVANDLRMEFVKSHPDPVCVAPAPNP